MKVLRSKKEPTTTRKKGPSPKKRSPFFWLKKGVSPKKGLNFFSLFFGLAVRVKHSTTYLAPFRKLDLCLTKYDQPKLVKKQVKKRTLFFWVSPFFRGRKAFFFFGVPGLFFLDQSNNWGAQNHGLLWHQKSKILH